MPYSHLLGNEPIKIALERMVAQQKVPHAMLFSGLEGVGKFQFAKALAIQLMGASAAPKINAHHHPDLHLYFPEGKSALHPIEQIRFCIQEMEMPPFEAPVKVFIIDQAHQMLPTSSNALLKTLEEPPNNTYLILLTDQPEQLLPTIVSRCRKYSFCPVPTPEIARYLVQCHQVDTVKAGEVAARSYGSFARALQGIRSADRVPRQLIEELMTCDPHREYTRFMKGCVALEEALVLKNEESGSLVREVEWILEEALIQKSKRLPLHLNLIQETFFEQVEQARQAIARHVRPRVIFEWLFSRN